MGINQIALAVSEMDTVTQQNAALVEESAAITANMDDEAHQLAKLVSQFKVDEEKETLSRFESTQSAEAIDTQQK